MEDIKCDIVVVGGGPAGSMTAKWAAMHGSDVLVIEKRQEIGSPVRCGEGISKHWISDVGIRIDNKWIANEVEGARIFSPSLKHIVVNEKMAGNEVGYMIERDQFDKALAVDAAKAGARYMVKTSAVGLLKDGNNKLIGVKAKHMGEHFNIFAKLIIGADGFESQVGRWAGINTILRVNDVESCLQYRMAGIECDTRYSDFYLGSAAPGGYVWVFPKGDGVANVGIGIQLKYLKHKSETKTYLDNFIKKMPGLKKGKIIDMVAGAVSVSQPLKEVTKDNIMLVGDSGRMIDPLTGGGIASACIAGKIAGNVAAEALESRDFSKQFFQKYEKGWRAELEEKFYRNWMAKERLSVIDDITFDKLADILQDVKLEKLTAHNLLKVVKERYPEVVKGFEGFI
ncbi:MAG: NAD(P)/FAD-dependent oxidoreductase [Candidatus Thermoplasmatota archaeon]|jgi:digeranylgeranylglycerophospholipid reductase|nr:NAD(P)/FAD-dependent oxidoreductase [Candidatus Thermoplasmatota archaeon]MCL5963452.1 NAD(P)/FAD-dependent oxidoreductase [Candidatus Thermoplasmatota archaeon]